MYIYVILMVCIILMDSVRERHGTAAGTFHEEAKRVTQPYKVVLVSDTNYTECDMDNDCDCPTM